MPRINYYVLIKGNPCLLENQTISACENVEQEGQGLEGKEGEREGGVYTCIHDKKGGER